MQWKRMLPQIFGGDISDGEARVALCTPHINPLDDGCCDVTGNNIITHYHRNLLLCTICTAEVRVDFPADETMRQALATLMLAEKSWI